MNARLPAAHARLPLALLVDRDEDTRTMYAEFLRARHYDAVEADDGREALAKAFDIRPDIVVTETRLPGLSGFDLCALLHKDPATHEIPVIFVTGDAFDVDVARARASGADGVLIKPCLPETLLIELHRVVAKSETLRKRSQALLEKSVALRSAGMHIFDNIHPTARRITLSKALHRGDTTTPPTPPPALVCPECDRPLKYTRSHIGGVSARHLEQWDYYECAAGCGTFQYRERTRRLRKI
jgi:two-component system, cell cycle response regulator DivK